MSVCREYVALLPFLFSHFLRPPFPDKDVYAPFRTTDKKRDRATEVSQGLMSSLGSE